MKRKSTLLKHEFVEYIPDQIEEGTLYISMDYATVVHKCCCGCGNEVVIPISPTDWKLIFNGASITLDPSIGNWGYECGSHYWIENSKVMWAGEWSKERIAAARHRDYINKNKNYNGHGVSSSGVASSERNPSYNVNTKNTGLLSKLKKWFIS